MSDARFQDPAGYIRDVQVPRSVIGGIPQETDLLFIVGELCCIETMCTATRSQEQSTTTIVSRQPCLDLVFELKGMISMDQCPEEFDPINGQIHG
jgi:hypothetical protein